MSPGSVQGMEGMPGEMPVPPPHTQTHSLIQSLPLNPLNFYSFTPHPINGSYLITEVWIVALREVPQVNQQRHPPLLYSLPHLRLNLQFYSLLYSITLYYVHVSTLSVWVCMSIMYIVWNIKALYAIIWFVGKSSCLMLMTTYKALFEKFLGVLTEKYWKSSKSSIFAVPEDVRGLCQKSKKKHQFGQS